MMDHLKHELAIARRMQHENVIVLYEILHTEDKIFLVTEIAQGGELLARICECAYKSSSELAL